MSPVSILQSIGPETISRCVAGAAPLIFKSCFKSLPAISKWMKYEKTRSSETADQQASGPDQLTLRLNRDYFMSLIEDTKTDPLVYVESGRYTQWQEMPIPDNDHERFIRTQIPLSLFLKMQDIPAESSPYGDLYLAQTSLLDDLPLLLEDVKPAMDNLPHLKHVYGTSTWIGRRTFTPRHFDANENLYVMIGGQKRITLWEPSHKRGKGYLGNNNFGEPSSTEKVFDTVILSAGDGLFIPNRWWHEISSVGNDMTASVNWWFRSSEKERSSINM
ncbi:hypothetical protein V1511DRAFT_393662 [Dipodascopsis uninucleata]